MGGCGGRSPTVMCVIFYQSKKMLTAVHKHCLLFFMDKFIFNSCNIVNKLLIKVSPLYFKLNLPSFCIF